MHIMAKSLPGLRDYPGIGFWPLAASTITFTELCVSLDFTVGVLLVIIEARCDHRGCCLEQW
jgi:hypothetical protein